MANNPFIKQLDARLKGMKSRRSTFEHSWQDITDLAHPLGGDFTTKRFPGEERTLNIYDSTAKEALLDSAGGMHSFLTNPAEQWFELTIESDDATIRENTEAKAWVQRVQRELYKVFRSKKSGWGNMLSEIYPDTLAFGNAVMMSAWNKKLRTPRFRAYPLASVWMEENSDGIVDVIFREFEWTKRQIMQEWPDVVFDTTDAGKQASDKLTVVHAIFPNTDLDPKVMEIPSPSRMKELKDFREVWYIVDSFTPIQITGLDTFPYHVARWQVLTGEVYGRGPADTCLPDIRMLQRMERVGLRSMEKEVDPPIVLPTDGYVLPLHLDPSGVTLKEPGAEPIEYLQNPNKRIDIAFEKLEQKRDSIRRCFHVDLFRTAVKKERQTALEFAELRNESLRLIAPILARMEAEFLGKALVRTIELLSRHTDLIPPKPPVLKGVHISIGYNSAAAKAQKALVADSISRFLEELAPLGNIRPEVFDKIDIDATVDRLAEARSMPQTILLTANEVAKLRQDRAEAQQNQANQQNAESLSKAALNVAQAQSA